MYSDQLLDLSTLMFKKYLLAFALKYIMPSRGNHLPGAETGADWDLHVNWKRLQDHYGSDFNFQLIELDRSKDRVWLPPLSWFRSTFLKYLNNEKNSDFKFFRLQWLINDYVLTGWRYPVQAVWNWRWLWWEIHPGLFRGLVYNLLGTQKWTAWYQPLTNKKVKCLHKFTDPDILLDTMNFRDYHKVEAEPIWYFNRPLIKLLIHITEQRDSAKEFQEVFYNNIANGINIVASDNIVKKIQKEMTSWPEHLIKTKIVFNQQGTMPTLIINKYNKNLFYAGLYFAGTRIKNYSLTGLSYRNDCY